MYTYNPESNLYERTLQGVTYSYNRVCFPNGHVYYELRTIKWPNGMTQSSF